MTAHHNGGIGLVLPDQLAHLFDLFHIGNDGADADDVIGALLEFLDKDAHGGKIQ